MADGRTIGTMGLVLSRFLDQVVEKHPEVNYVYDEKLGIESSLTKLRSKYQQEGIANRSEFPLFSFNRSALKFSPHGMGRRSVINRAFNRSVNSNDQIIIHKATQATIDIKFMHVMNSAENQEIFEVDFLGESGFSSVKEFKVEIPDLGEFDYFVQYTDLIEKNIESNGIYHKTVTGTATILGWFFSLQGTSKYITQIESTIKNFNDLVLVSTTIVAP